MTLTTKWTKKSIKTLQGIISSFYLSRRPPTGAPSYEFLAKFREVLSARRKGILVLGLRSHITIGRERVEQYEGVALHYETHFKDIEIASRFRNLAAKEAKGVASTERLLKQVEFFELPPEVSTFNPAPDLRTAS